MKCEKISIKYGWDKVRPLGELDITFCTGQLYSFIGNNGTGKSTLYKTLLGVITPLNGKVQRSFIDSAVLVSDYINIPNEGRVSDLIWFAATPENGDTVATKYGEFEQYIRSLWNKNISSLSSGQKKILELYIALANNKKWFIFDEATNSLDNSNRNLLFKYIDILLKNGASVLYTSHNMEEIVLLKGSVFLLNGKDSVAPLTKNKISIEYLNNILGGC